MNRILLKSKIHRVTVTQADLDYDGSITVDRALLQAADMIPYERVELYDVTNGARLATYVLPGPAGSGIIGINGAAAHLVHPGDLLIIASYAEYDASEWSGHVPIVVHVDQRNRIRAGDLVSAAVAAE